MKRQGLPRSRRLHLKEDFKNIIQGGKRISGHGLVLWYKPAPDGQTERRLGIVVSKKLGGAVVRVRVKRLLREAFRINREKLANGMDYIFHPTDSEALATLQLAQEALLGLCHRAKLLPAGKTWCNGNRIRPCTRKLLR